MIKDNNYCHFYLKLIEFLAFLLEFAWIEIGCFRLTNGVSR
ncbi:hypothetical protein AO382_1980 [Moraxella catarrhalis]|uniref:Uncharacterized protein n=1 Tax=Moraxella catarrhalis TaxID=480 RepID=A0A7Z0UWX3_MORCA|nr:hypothetical protein AO382_1980 [Moraxella catarrhalis]